jgi:hypothetical protein
MEEGRPAHRIGRKMSALTALVRSHGRDAAMSNNEDKYGNFGLAALLITYIVALAVCAIP